MRTSLPWLCPGVLCRCGHSFLVAYSLNALVRGEAGAEVEFGNNHIRVEQQEGLLVDWDFLLKNQGACTLERESLDRFRGAFGLLPRAVVTDRGFDGPGNRELIDEKNDMYNAICPKSTSALQEKI